MGHSESLSLTGKKPTKQVIPDSSKQRRKSEGRNLGSVPSLNLARERYCQFWILGKLRKWNESHCLLLLLRLSIDGLEIPLSGSLPPQWHVVTSLGKCTTFWIGQCLPPCPPSFSNQTQERSASQLMVKCALKSQQIVKKLPRPIL